MGLIRADQEVIRGEVLLGRSSTQPIDRGFVGVYELTPEVRYTIRRDGDTLVGQRAGRPEEPIKAEVADLFFVPGKPSLRKVFQRGPDGRITGFVERRESWDIAWKRRER